MISDTYTANEPMPIDTIAEWEALSVEQKANHLCYVRSESRTFSEGGYSDVWNVFDLNGEMWVAIATEGYKGQPDLIFQSAAEFIEENKCFVVDGLDEDD